jgi:splicing factor 3B subunit 4
MGRGMPMPMNYQSVPPSQQGRPGLPPPSSLTTPPPGLPARPPPSQAGYGGPQTFLPPGFNGAGQQPPYPPQAGAPPPGFGPPGFAPPAGAPAAPGAPPSLPPGFQQPGYGTGR